MRKVIVPVAIVGMIILDQLSKAWIVSHLQLDEVVSFLPGVFSLTHLRNYGAAFSMLQNQQWLFTVITFLVIGSALYYLWKHFNGSYWLLSGLSLIIAGGLGNFIDRLRLGYVVDMVHLDFMNFAIFNMADSYLTIGVVVLMIAFWKEEENGSNR
ncbi:signal peptidase II [Streptococcus saliviloxodontae]|uniref:Lipoprotein signal peptidase n=1 Tax=Streptococcus saliviloxodontae TaxID=1349416 RepID=A0ABS2PLB5_9STRE|nr:signal peptidase II [Streptococcus saliviloxodontae]MBM7636072.1 signal peptidase II [Streptococcus saliviloxodontae]